MAARKRITKTIRKTYSRNSLAYSVPLWTNGQTNGCYFIRDEDKWKAAPTESEHASKRPSGPVGEQSVAGLLVTTTLTHISGSGSGVSGAAVVVELAVAVVKGKTT